MSPNRSAQTNIKLTEERKRRWTEAAEEEGRSLSNFIRYSVEQQLERSESTTESANTGVRPDQIDELTDHMTEVLEETKRIQNDISRLNGRMNVLEKEVGEREPVEGLKNKVYGLLPREGDIPTGSEEYRRVSKGGAAHPIDMMNDGRIVTGEPRHIAQYLNEGDTGDPILDREVSPEEVERAINDLQDELYTIHRHHHNDGGYYRDE